MKCCSNDNLNFSSQFPQTAFCLPCLVSSQPRQAASTQPSLVWVTKVRFRCHKNRCCLPFTRMPNKWKRDTFLFRRFRIASSKNSFLISKSKLNVSYLSFVSLFKSAIKKVKCNSKMNKFDITSVKCSIRGLNSWLKYVNAMIGVSSKSWNVIQTNVFLQWLNASNQH